MEKGQRTSKRASSHRPTRASILCPRITSTGKIPSSFVKRRRKRKKKKKKTFLFKPPSPFSISAHSDISPSPIAEKKKKKQKTTRQERRKETKRKEKTVPSSCVLTTWLIFVHHIRILTWSSFAAHMQPRRTAETPPAFLDTSGMIRFICRF